MRAVCFLHCTHRPLNLRSRMGIMCRAVFTVIDGNCEYQRQAGNSHPGGSVSKNTPHLPSFMLWWIHTVAKGVSQSQPDLQCFTWCECLASKQNRTRFRSLCWTAKGEEQLHKTLLELSLSRPWGCQPHWVLPHYQLLLSLSFKTKDIKLSLQESSNIIHLSVLLEGKKNIRESLIRKGKTRYDFKIRKGT